MYFEHLNQKQHRPSLGDILRKLVHKETDWRPKDMNGAVLQRIMTNIGARPQATYQIRSMARLFGLNAQQLSTPKLRAETLAQNCSACTLAKTCFRTKTGAPDTTPNIAPQKCPNFKTFQTLARDSGSRTAIHNKLV
ncbi:hypothetical protein NBRC116601_13860 [Cognatishimia sp. WU-CL00825]|uniref:hypothetical protein n=1 Tax=Cognatishimia sp. WU-CL00825 TaxID=3127658 RepID=UPI0031062A16